MSDSRYDPRFQRDWDGELPPPAAPAPTPAAAPRIEPPERAGTREPRETPQTPDPARRFETAAAPEPAAAAEPEAAVDPEAAADPEPVPARNPYRIALIVAGVVLVACAVGVIWQLAQPTTSSDGTDFALVQLESMVAPWVLLGGLIAVVAGIAVGAVRRR